MTLSRKTPRAFTLIEVLVVVAIIALLVAIILPSLRNAREQAKEVVCASLESQLGRGFYGYAATNRDWLCSGSFDPDVNNGRDGPVDKIGWVADQVNSKTAKPGTMLCPSNLAKVNQKLGTSGLAGSGCMGKIFSNGDDYRTWELIDRRIQNGYNTNYTQSWYMARTQMKKPGNSKRVRDTAGPLKTAAMTRIAPGRVPLMGDGGIEDDDTGDSYHGKYAGEYGTRTVKTMTDGPYGGGAWAPQSYSDFGPAHGFGAYFPGKKGSVRERANVLFGDGHVDKFTDRVRNGAFNLVTREDGDAVQYVQEDLDARVFDGVLSAGRRSNDPEGFTLQ